MREIASKVQKSRLEGWCKCIATIIMLTIPIFVPIVKSLGFSPIWFGVIVVLSGELAAIPHPIAIGVWVLAGLLKTLLMGTIYRGIIPFVI